MPISGRSNDGVVVAYSRANRSMSAAGNAYGPTDIAFNGITATYTLPKIFTQPLWQTFGYLDGRGNPVARGLVDSLHDLTDAVQHGLSALAVLPVHQSEVLRESVGHVPAPVVDARGVHLA